MTIAELSKVYEKHPDMLFASKSYHYNWLTIVDKKCMYMAGNGPKLTVFAPSNREQQLALDDYIYAVPVDASSRQVFLTGTVAWYLRQGFPYSEVYASVHSEEEIV